MMTLPGISTMIDYVWCVENAPHDNFQSRDFEKRGDKYFREYPLEEFHWAEDKKIISENLSVQGNHIF